MEKSSIHSTASKQRGSVGLSLDWQNIINKEAVEARRDLLRGIAYDRSIVNFCTGSSYTGKWNALGMSVYGSYIFPYGCEYEGGFEDGKFHGEGTISYPMGQKLDGVWHEGKIMSYTFSNIDGLTHEKPWSYCQMPDRRFLVSIREGLQPAGREFLTNRQPTRSIDSHSYDTGDGFFDYRTNSIVTDRDPEDYADLEKRASIEMVEASDEDDFWVNGLTMVGDEKAAWIKKNCRKGWHEPTGYRPDLYPDWVTGSRKEIEQLNLKYETGPAPDERKISESQKPIPSVSQPQEVVEPIQYAGTGRKLLPSSRSLLSTISF